MKKTLIALAAVAATGAAFAQSSVTLYGRIDLGHANVKKTTTVGTTSSSTKTSSLAGDEHGRTTSRLGVTGTEDLGGGLSAGFNFETKLNPDSTASDGFGGTRLANLNLNGGFGTVLIGTYLNSLDSLRGYSAGTYSAPGGDFLADHNGLSGRSTNAIAYRSPNFGGFVGSIGLMNESSSTTANGVQGAQTKASGLTLAGSYNAGPLSAMATIVNAKTSTIAGAVAGTPATYSYTEGVQTGQIVLTPAGTAAVNTAGKVNDSGFAVSYDLGYAKPYLAFEQGKTTPTRAGGVAVNGSYNKFRAFEFGSTFPMGAFTPYVLVGTGKKSSAANNVAGASAKTSAFQVGTTYALSKRTYVYGAVGTQQEKDTTTTTAAAARAKVKESGYKMGLVHSF